MQAMQSAASARYFPADKARLASETGPRWDRRFMRPSATLVAVQTPSDRPRTIQMPLPDDNTVAAAHKNDAAYRPTHDFFSAINCDRSVAPPKRASRGQNGMAMPAARPLRRSRRCARASPLPMTSLDLRRLVDAQHAIS